MYWWIFIKQPLQKHSQTIDFREPTLCGQVVNFSDRLLVEVFRENHYIVFWDFIILFLLQGVVEMSKSVHELVSIDKIELDKKNPRIAKWIEIYGGHITADHMGLALGAGDSQLEEGTVTFHSLKESIRTNGGVIHPIIVNKQNDGSLVVIEGNTRTYIYREFKEQGLSGDWSKIPAMVYTELSQTEIDAIRLQAHLVGPRPWDPYSKAKYLDYLRNSKHLTFAQIVDFCGGRKREVIDYIAAYNDMEKFYRPLLEEDSEFDPTRFSSFVELQRPKVTDSIIRNNFTKGDFAGWVKEQLISPQNMVRNIPRILDNLKSKKIFLHDGAQEAMKALDTPSIDEAVKDAALEQLAREIIRRVLKMDYSQLLRLRLEVNSDENEILCEARDHLNQLCKDIASDE